jgi:hypothetical protein
MNSNTMTPRLLRSYQPDEDAPIRPPAPDYQQACERAKTLLLRLLNDDDREYFERTRCVRVTGSNGGQYELECNDFTGNVRKRVAEVDGVFRWQRYCAHIPHRDRYGHRMPEYDNVIAQLLALRTDELGFLRTANQY